MKDDEATERLRRELLATASVVPTSTLGRLWRTGRGAAGMGAALLRGRDGETVDAEAVAAVVRQLGGLKGVAMKFGQMLGYVDPTLPEELRSLLSLLQTAAPATGWAQVEAVLRAELGAQAEGLIGGLERAPVAVASIGQVHRGRLPDGSPVAVKVRHPGIEAALTADFRAAGVGKAMGALMGMRGVSGVIEEARATFLEECDYGREAEHQRRFGRIFADDPVIVVPEVMEEWSRAQVLVTRWTPGRSLEAFLAGRPSQAERDAAGAALFRFWLRTLYREGLFHADPHPGNFAFLPKGQVAIYDFGCVRSFAPGLRQGFAHLAAATREDDAEAMAAALVELGGRAPTGAKQKEHVRRLLRAFFGPLLTPGRRRIAADEGLAVRGIVHDKRALLGLDLSPRLLFLFRLRFGLYAVLSRLEAALDWAETEAEWARMT